jgi:hypothetical protein
MSRGKAEQYEAGKDCKYSSLNRSWARCTIWGSLGYRKEWRERQEWVYKSKSLNPSTANFLLQLLEQKSPRETNSKLLVSTSWTNCSSEAEKSWRKHGLKAKLISLSIKRSWTTIPCQLHNEHISSSFICHLWNIAGTQMSILSANISAKIVTTKRNPIFGDNQG